MPYSVKSLNLIGMRKNIQPVLHKDTTDSSYSLQKRVVMIHTNTQINLLHSYLLFKNRSWIDWLIISCVYLMLFHFAEIKETVIFHKLLKVLGVILKICERKFMRENVIWPCQNSLCSRLFHSKKYSQKLKNPNPKITASVIT